MSTLYALINWDVKVPFIPMATWVAVVTLGAVQIDRRLWRRGR